MGRQAARRKLLLHSGGTDAEQGFGRSNDRDVDRSIVEVDPLVGPAKIRIDPAEDRLAVVRLAPIVASAFPPFIRISSSPGRAKRPAVVSVRHE
jgi:hypothetical protein